MMKIKSWEQFLNESEKYNSIIEEFPIKDDIEKSETCGYYRITVPPIKMSYDTYLDIGDIMSDNVIKYDEGQGLKYPADIKEFRNDVSMSGYDYSDGGSEFTASTEKDVDNWLKLYSDKVYSEKY